MILVDTSVWIDHLHRAEPRLVTLLERDEVVTHEGILAELALLSLRDRTRFLSLLGRLRRAPVMRHEELMAWVERERLWGRGLSAVDVHLAGGARLGNLTLWTRDKCLRAVAAELGVALLEDAAPEGAGLQ